MTGDFDGVLDLGGDPLTSAGGFDFFVAKFDADGNHVRSHQFGDVSDQFNLEVAVDDSDDAVVFGDFLGSVDFGTGSHTASGRDVVLARLDFGVPAAVEDARTVAHFGLTSYPNPFNPGTTVVFELPGTGAVTVAVYDVHGALVRTLVNLRWRGQSPQDYAYQVVGKQLRPDRAPRLPKKVMFTQGPTVL